MLNSITANAIIGDYHDFFLFQEILDHFCFSRNVYSNPRASTSFSTGAILSDVKSNRFARRRMGPEDPFRANRIRRYRKNYICPRRAEIGRRSRPGAPLFTSTRLREKLRPTKAEGQGAISTLCERSEGWR